jgi:hypothetical protein
MQTAVLHPRSGCAVTPAEEQAEQAAKVKLGGVRLRAWCRTRQQPLAVAERLVRSALKQIRLAPLKV